MDGCAQLSVGQARCPSAAKVNRSSRHSGGAACKPASRKLPSIHRSSLQCNTTQCIATLRCRKGAPKGTTGQSDQSSPSVVRKKTLKRCQPSGGPKAKAATARPLPPPPPKPRPRLQVGASRNVTSNTGWQPTSALYRCYHGGNSKSSSSLCKRSAHENRKASVHAPATQLQLKGLLCQVGPLCVVQTPHIVCRGTAAGQQRAVSNKRALHCAAKIQAVAGQAGRQACLGQCWAGTDGHRTCSATQPPLQHSINSLA